MSGNDREPAALDYRSAGVDIEAAEDAKGRLKRLVGVEMSQK